MPKSTATCNSILALMYNATAWANVADNTSTSAITNIEVSLHTATPTAASDAQNESETAYTNYNRQPVARSTGGWSAPSGGSTHNVAQIQFDQCGASGATLTSVSTGTAHTSTGHKWHYGDLNSHLAIS